MQHTYEINPKTFSLLGAGGRRMPKYLSSLWRFAVCQPDHMLMQDFFNKNRTWILENYKNWYRKHQVQKLQLCTLTANHKSTSKTQWHQETSHQWERSKVWNTNALPMIPKHHLLHPHEMSKPNLGCHTLATHRGSILQSLRTDCNIHIPSLPQFRSQPLYLVGGKRWVLSESCLEHSR